MKMNIQGTYTINIPITTMFLNKTLTLHRHNIITEFGESFFLHRAIDNQFEPIQNILLGNGTTTPRRTNTKLTNQRYSKKPVCTIDNKNKQIKLTANFTITQLLETTEIGVSTYNQSKKEVLISHDVFQQLDTSVFTGISGDVTIEYIYQFTTTYQKNNWTLYDENNMIYYTGEENRVITVFENNIGYREVSEIGSIGNTPGVFYYDNLNKILYIRPFSDVSTSDITIQI